MKGRKRVNRIEGYVGDGGREGREGEGAEYLLVQ